jgi:ComF family protein
MVAPQCLCCGTTLQRPLDGPVCAACWAAIPPVVAPCCAICGDSLAGAAAAGAPTGRICTRCRRSPPPFVRAQSAGRHAGSLRRILHAFKYEGRRALARPLAARLLTGAPDALAAVDIVVPVPLHPWRAMQRGFNQAEDLARELKRPVWCVLRRRGLGPRQASLPAARRHGNVRRAFALKAAFQPGGVRRRRLANLHVLLVDDVLTTGATAGACARVLIEAGVASVRVLTVARAATALPPRPPAPPDRAAGPPR